MNLPNPNIRVIQDCGTLRHLAVEVIGFASIKYCDGFWHVIPLNPEPHAPVLFHVLLDDWYNILVDDHGFYLVNCRGDLNGRDEIYIVTHQGMAITTWEAKAIKNAITMTMGEL